MAATPRDPAASEALTGAGIAAGEGAPDAAASVGDAESPPWSPRRAEDHLDALAPIGWDLGLDRIRAVCERLGRPQDRFRAVHVVGTNGKTSVATMTAALLRAHGVADGAYLSPHLHDWAERVRVGGTAVDPALHAAAVGRAAEAAVAVEAERAAGDRVTQFELATAAALLALAEAGVEVAAIEAGLGGRLDATNVLDAELCVLTSVGLDHTEWLGETLEQIADEKLAVVPEGGRLLVGADLAPAALARARRRCAEIDATLIEVPARFGLTGELRVPGAHQRANFALAAAACEQIAGRLDAGAAGAVAAELEIPLRLQRIADDPPTYLDGAHNPDAAAALAAALQELAGGPRGAWGCVAILEGKDADGILAALAPSLAGVVATGFAGTHGAGRPAMTPAQVAERCRAAGIAEVRCEPDPRAALAAAQSRARDDDRMAIAAGSLYLLAALWTATPDPS